MLETVGQATLTLNSWGDVTAAVAVVGAIFTALGVGATTAYTRTKARVETRAADAQAQDRLIALVKEEAEKRVAIVRLEFEKQIAEMKLAHAHELAAVRVDFQAQIAQLALGQRRLDDLAGVPHADAEKARS